MYDIIKSVIESGRYELTDMLNKIDTIWLQGGITEEQKTELVGMARDNANPENSYAPMQEQINGLVDWVTKLESRISNIETKWGVTPPEGTVDTSTTEYPEYVKPTDKKSSYDKGDKVTFNGKHYSSNKNNNMYSPDEMPDWWTLES